MLIASINETNRLRKRLLNRLTKGMSNIYLKVAIGKNWRSQNFNLLSSKKVLPGQFLGHSCRYHWISKLVLIT